MKCGLARTSLSSQLSHSTPLWFVLLLFNYHMVILVLKLTKINHAKVKTISQSFKAMTEIELIFIIENIHLIPATAT